MPNGNQQTIEIAENRIPYWSRFLTQVDLRYNGVDRFVTQLNAGFEIPVFDYRRGEQNVQALNGARSTIRDTILTNASQTRGGAMYAITGFSITKDGYPYQQSPNTQQGKQGTIHGLPFPAGSNPAGNGGGAPDILSAEDFRGLDSFMWETLQKFFVLQLAVDGTSRTIEFGPSLLYPGTGGPSGGNIDTNNGSTFVANYMHLKNPIYWNPAGAVDSDMSILLKAAYDMVTPTFTAPDGLAPDGDPIEDPNPTPLGRVWVQGWVLSMHGQELKPTSQVS